MANYSAHFPLRDIYFHGTWIRAGQLVLVFYAAANTQRGAALSSTHSEANLKRA